MSEPAQDRPVRVLWLEDEPLLRRAIRFTAEDLGLDVRLAGSREEADRCLGTESFDWIICDYQLTAGTSATFVRARLAEGHRVAVVTGDASRVDPALGVRVFEKPFRLHEMLEELAILGPSALKPSR